MIRANQLGALSLTLLITVSLLAVFGLSLGAILLRPGGEEWAAWWPAAGVAAGLAARFPRDRVYPVIGAIVLVSSTASFMSGRSALLALVVGLVSGLEAKVASRVLRGPNDQRPGLSDVHDLRRLMFAVVMTAIVCFAGLGAITWVIDGPVSALTVGVSAAPSHAAGTLLVAPLFFRSPRRGSRIRRVERICQWALVVASVVFGFGLNNFGWPLAFLLVAPLVWGAARLRFREFAVQFALTAIAISIITVLGRGPFDPQLLTTSWSEFVTNLFIVTTGGAVFTVLVLVSVQNDLTAELARSEALLHEAIYGSLLGIAVLDIEDDIVMLRNINRAGSEMLGRRPNEVLTAQAIFSKPGIATLRRGLSFLGKEQATSWSAHHLPTTEGRLLDATLVALPDYRDVPQFSLQFADVTEHAREVATEARELRRAVEVEQALLPQLTLDIPGYQVAGRRTQAKSLGGDFLDWYEISGGIAVVLGDVMGKGMAASMIASAVRASLRMVPASLATSKAIERTAHAIGGDLQAASVFVTLFHAHLRLGDGRVTYTDAGHGLAFIVRANGMVDRLESRGLPLGALENQHWTQDANHLRVGDTMVVFSDGVLDVFDGSLKAIDEVASLVGPASSARSIVDTISQRAAKAHVEDDVTILVVRREA